MTAKPSLAHSSLSLSLSIKKLPLDITMIERGVTHGRGETDRSPLPLTFSLLFLSLFFSLLSLSSVHQPNGGEGHSDLPSLGSAPSKVADGGEVDSRRMATVAQSDR